MAKPVTPGQRKSDKPRFLTVGKVTRSVFRDPVTGQEFSTRAALRGHQKQRANAILTHFSTMLDANTLGLDPWAKMPFESPTDYSRFQAYLTQAVPHPQTGVIPRRSITTLSRALGFTTESAKRRLQSLGRRAHWELRAKAWDREVDRQVAEEFIEAKRLSVRRQARLGQKMQAAAERAVDNIILTGALEVSPGDAARLAKEGMTIERLAHDQSTRNEAVRTETRLVWEGPTPPWASHAVAVEASDQDDDGTNTTLPKPKSLVAQVGSQS